MAILYRIFKGIFCISKMNIYKIRRNYYRKKECKGNVNKKSLLVRRVSHVTYYAGGNAGDMVLSHCIRKIFESSIKDLCWNIVNVRDEVTWDIINEINMTKGVIVGGGGLFLPDSNKNDISGWQWAISEEKLNSIKVPLVVYSVGYNYFRGQECNSLFIKNLITLCRKAQLIALRNHGSMEAVKKLIPSYLHDKIIFQPCITTVLRKVCGKELETKRISKVIAFNIAFDRSNMRFGANKELILEEIARSAKMIQNKGYNIVLVYHVGSDSQMRYYMDKIGVRYTIKDLTTSFPDKIIKFYNNVDLVIGMRGHSQMIPFGLNCEILSLVTHDKMQWFLDDINASEWKIDLVNSNEKIGDEIYKKFIQIHEIDSQKTRKKLIDSQEKLWNITLNNIEKIKAIINISDN